MNEFTPPTTRRPPSLVITVPYESRGQVVLIAESYEDEIRLKTWIGKSGVLHRLADELDLAA